MSTGALITLADLPKGNRHIRMQISGYNITSATHLRYMTVRYRHCFNWNLKRLGCQPRKIGLYLCIFYEMATLLPIHLHF